MHDERGQMAVELAVLVPVIVVVALVVYNLARFVSVCATFDRVALDAVISQGIAPAGEQTQLAAVDAVRDCIEEALSDVRSCDVEVFAERATDGAEGNLVLTGMLTRFRCVLSFRPWPSVVTMPGVPYGAPLCLRHERSIVVDRYRPGVVM